MGDKKKENQFHQNRDNISFPLTKYTRWKPSILNEQPNYSHNGSTKSAIIAITHTYTNTHLHINVERNFQISLPFYSIYLPKKEKKDSIKYLPNDSNRITNFIPSEIPYFPFILIFFSFFFIPLYSLFFGFFLLLLYVRGLL